MSMVATTISDIDIELDGWSPDPMRVDGDPPSEGVGPVITWCFRERRDHPVEELATAALLPRRRGLAASALPLAMVVLATAVLAVAVLVFGGDRVGEAPTVRTVDVPSGKTTATTSAVPGSDPAGLSTTGIPSIEEELRSRDTGVIVIPALDG